MHFSLKTILCLSILYSSAGFAGVCSSMEQVNQVVQKIFDVDSDRSLLDGLGVARKDITSLFIIEPYIEFLFDNDGTIETFRNDLGNMERFFSSANVIRVPLIAKLKDGRTFVTEMSLANKKDGTDLCAWQGRRGYFQLEETTK